MKKKLIGFTLGTTALLILSSGSILKPLEALSAVKKSVKWGCYLQSNKYVGSIISTKIDGENIHLPISENEAINQCNNIDFILACEGICTVKPEKW